MQTEQQTKTDRCRGSKLDPAKRALVIAWAQEMRRRRKAR